MRRYEHNDVPATSQPTEIPGSQHNMREFNQMFGNLQIGQNTESSGHQGTGTDYSQDPRYSGLHEQLQKDKATIRTYQTYDQTNLGYSQVGAHYLHDKALNGLSGNISLDSAEGRTELWTKGQMLLTHVGEISPGMVQEYEQKVFVSQMASIIKSTEGKSWNERQPIHQELLGRMGNNYTQTLRAAERNSVIQRQYDQRAGTYGSPQSSTRWAEYNSFLSHVVRNSSQLFSENLGAIQCAEQLRVSPNMSPEWIRQERQLIDWHANQAAQNQRLPPTFGNCGRNDAWTNSMTLYPDRYNAATNQWSDQYGSLYPTTVNGGGIGWYRPAYHQASVNSGYGLLGGTGNNGYNQ